MQLKLEKFLKITAVLASAGALAVGCTVNQDVDDNPNTGGTGGGSAGTGGGAAGSAGSSGSGGTAGSSGSGGTAGSSGAGGSAGADAGTECLGDTLSNPDAGVEGGPCGNLTYIATTCPGPDAGAEGAPSPDGVVLCDYMHAHGRAGVTEELFNCLNALPAASACDASHTTGVNACISSVFPQACDTGGVTFPDAGVVTCQDVATSCPAVSGGTVGITANECQDSINAMNPQTRMDIMQCYNDAAPATGDCADDFTACVFAIDNY